MKKVLLLNPPGKGYFIRDYYCSHIAKGRYCWLPLDLLVLSGVLKGHCEVQVLDANVSQFSRGFTLTAVKSSSANYIVCLVGAASWNNDIDFLQQLSKEWKGVLVLSGDYPLACPQKVLDDYPFVDAILLDFTESDILEMICQKKPAGLRNILTRNDLKQPECLCSREFSIPVPDYRIFPIKKYHMPHIYHHPFATVMTDFGCPFNCTFCPMERIKYKVRSIANIGKELQFLKSIGIKELWLRDQSFGSVTGHALEVCRLIGSFNDYFSWSCEMRVDAAEQNLLETMKKAGCHTVMFGVETAEESVLREHRKNITLFQVQEAFVLAKQIGLRRLAHFILGLNGETMESQLRLIDFSIELNPEFASFNIAAPLWNTTFRDMVVGNAWAGKDGVEIDSSCSYPAWANGALAETEVWKLRKTALRKFYLRPQYILGQTQNIRTPYQLYSLLTQGWGFLRNLGSLR